MRLGRDICCQLPLAERREWLVTNGLGGYASGTVAGSLSRRYHGLLVAALHPPLGRTLLAAKLEETAFYLDARWPLAVNRWRDATVDPHGHLQIESFHLEGTVPVWTYAIADALLEKRIWMRQGANTTGVRYTLRRGGNLRLELKLLANYRDYHQTTSAGSWQFSIQPVPRGLRIQAFDGAVPYYVLSDAAVFSPAHCWHYGFHLPLEQERGLPAWEDHLHAASIRLELRQGASANLWISTSESAGLEELDSIESRWARDAFLLRDFPAPEHPPWIRQLLLAADQFIVDRGEGATVIAGYPWFGDWGRDTMISLPGIALAAKRPAVAATILETFARYADGGMLPNRFPDGGEAPEYNTVDATLWYFEAIRQYYAATRDLDLLGQLFPVLEEMIRFHILGTRYGIRVDPADGLLSASRADVQLTWMDAKVGDWVVTPRAGKPVEVNALWVNALHTMGQFASLLGRDGSPYRQASSRAVAGFGKFWNPAANCCFDVIDGPAGNDAAVRPNQIFAVALPLSPLSPPQRQAVVDTCARRLLTSFGLRSLDPDHPSYHARYEGDVWSRDKAYHQGTVWGWLLGPFVIAHLRVYRDAALAASFLEPMEQQITAYGAGTLGEIFDAEAPFTPRGCIAQAWTVGEILRAWFAVRAAGRSSHAVF